MGNKRLQGDAFNYIDDINQVLDNNRADRIGHISTLVFILIFFLIIWAYFAMIDEMTVAEGKVIPSTKIKKIQSLEGGLIEKIYVKEGQTVVRDQQLLQIDDTDFNANLKEKQAKYHALLFKIARLSAEVNRQKNISWPKDIKAPELKRREQVLFNTRKKYLSDRVKSLQKQYDLLKEEVDLTARLIRNGSISKVELLQLQRKLLELKNELDTQKDSFYKQSQKELTEAGAEAKSIKESLTSNKHKVKRTAIYSPVDGIIKSLNVSTIGQVIQPGQDIIEILPVNDTLLIEARIKPKDIGFIAPNQQVTVKVSAYDFSIYGGLKGKVETIGADTFTNEQGGAYYLISVRTDKNYLGKKDNKLKIIAGMTVTVNILTGKKSVLSYLLKPILKVKQNALRER